MRLLGALLGLLLLAGCGDSGSGETTSATPNEETRFEKAVAQCEGTDPEDAFDELSGVTVGDEGHTLTMNSKEGSIENVVCVLVELETPESVHNRISHTTSLMGELTDEADGITYRWTYHPDNGLNIIATD